MAEPLSLKEFGRRTGCDYTTASRLLSGNRRPSTDLLNRICDAFGLDHGAALRVLGEDQHEFGKSGRSPRFADFLRIHVFQASSQDPPIAV